MTPPWGYVTPREFLRRRRSRYKVGRRLRVEAFSNGHDFDTRTSTCKRCGYVIPKECGIGLALAHDTDLPLHHVTPVPEPCQLRSPK